jgi:hypothetical protein
VYTCEVLCPWEEWVADGEPSRAPRAMRLLEAAPAGLSFEAVDVVNSQTLPHDPYLTVVALRCDQQVLDMLEGDDDCEVLWSEEEGS